ncbi:MAG: acyl-CoA desaturase, partial [Sciscionella sp.]
MTSALRTPPPARSEPDRRSLLQGSETTGSMVLVYVFLLVPMAALIAAVPLVWGWGLHWQDLLVAGVFFVVSGLGVTVGFHRHFTHGSFRAKRGLKVALAIAGSLSAQGTPITWVADHRRHHAFSDRAGDPHSPWLYGTGALALMKGFWHAHMGWLFGRDITNTARFAPDLVADRDVAKVSAQFPIWTAVTFIAPALLGGALSWSWWGLLTGFFWAGLVRVAVLHHVTWATNSICHMLGERPFASRDKAANFWPLAILSFGESWHNLHHA